MGSTSSPGRVAPGSEGPWVRPAVPDDSRPCPSSKGIHELSQTTHNLIRGPVLSPAGLDDSLLGLSSRGVDQLSRTSRAGVRGPAVLSSCPGRLGSGSECPRGRSAVQGYSGPCPRYPGVDQLSRTTRAGVLGPAGSTRSPGQIRPMSKARGFYQMSLATWPRVRVAAGLTSYLG